MGRCSCELGKRTSPNPRAKSSCSQAVVPRAPASQLQRLSQNIPISITAQPLEHKIIAIPTTSEVRVLSMTTQLFWKKLYAGATHHKTCMGGNVSIISEFDKLTVMRCGGGLWLRLQLGIKLGRIKVRLRVTLELV